MSTESIEISDLKFKLGDIIQIESTKQDYHLKHFFIEYIDDEVIKIIDINDGRKDSLDLDEAGCLTDIAIHKIYLLSRSDEEGYARQNGLLPETYIKIVFADDFEITGKIASLEEDMIEIEVDDDENIFLDFEYKGIPKNIPIKSVVIVEKPTIQEAIVAKAEKKVNFVSDEKAPSDKKASIEYSPEGDIIVNIPENATVDSVPSTDNFMIGKQIEFFADIEVRESEQRYGIEIQTNDLLDEMLSTIPDNARTFAVMERIHRIIRRFKELREKFSTFDRNGNILGFKNFNATYKPLVEHMDNLDTNLRWIIPVVKQKVKLYNAVTNDIVSSLNEDLKEYKNNMDVYKGNNNYSSFYNGINELFTPFGKFTGGNLLKSDTVKTDLEAIVDNLDDYYTQVYKKGNQIQNKKFFIQRYNLGMTKIGNKVLRSGKSVYLREPIGDNDTVSIKSVIMLPKPALEFSRVKLPGTNILTRTNLSQNWLYHYKMLTEKTNLSKMDVNKEYNEIDHEKENAFLDTALSFHIPNSDSPDYKTVLDSIIPRSASIIRLLKSQYIGYNFYDMLALFEPFMMYSDNITYAGNSKGSKNDAAYQGKGGPYQELRTHIIKNTNDYKKNFFKQIKKYGSLTKLKSANQKKNSVFEHIKLEMQNQLVKEYGIKNEKATATEVLNKMIELDNGNFYMSLCSVIMSHLYAPELAELLDSSEYGKDTFLQSKKCSSQVIAKKYTSLNALQRDNGKEEVYFDKEFDTTPYDILKKYKESQKEKTPEDFLNYFTLVLKKEHGIQSPETVAKTIIRGHKMVEEDNYAVLIIYPTLKSSFSENSLSAEEKESVELEADAKKRVSYFKRKGDNWVLDKEMDDSEMSNEFFCNSENSCFYDKNNEICDMADNAAKRMKKIAKKSLFETAVALTLEEFRKELSQMYELKERQIKKTRLIKEAKAEEFSVRAHHLGNKAKNVDVVVSPYAELRDQILAQTDFVQKQEHLILFSREHCRSAIEGESTYWLYCKETNMKLLPTFFVTLASSFPMGLYPEVLENIIAKQGKLSDDGDAIVDKHSGYVIRYLDFVAQDEFDDQGFVIKTHDMMKKDNSEIIEEAINAEIEGNQPKSDKPKKRTFEDQTNLYIYNVSSAISKGLGIDIDEIDDPVLSTASRIITNKVRSKDDFDKQMEKKVKKGEKTVSYEYYKNTEIFLITASITFIIIQSRIPSFTPKKTYPGCVFSLAGYPLDNSSGNKSGLNYLSCILEKMKSAASEPWKTVSKWKSDKWNIELTKYIDKHLEDPVIAKMLELKRNHLILNPDNELIPDVHSVEKWKMFQPPLIPSNIEKKVSGVSSPFANEIKESLKTGHSSQHQHIGNLYKKIVEHTYSVVDDINKIVLQVGKEAMLKAGSVIFLENSCCEESNVEKTITYFSEKDENIKKSIEFVQKYGQIYAEIKSLSIPAFALSHLKKTHYVSADSGNFSDENIYRAYIHYCKLKTNLPVPDDLQDICPEKIVGLDTMSLEQSIKVLNDNGRNQSKESLESLMVKVSRRNQVEISFSDEEVPLFDDLIIQDKIYEKIVSVLGSEDKQSLHVFLNNLNKRMQEDIFDYLFRYGNLKKQQINKNERNEKVYTGSIVDFIENVAVWSESKKSLGFIKNTIHYVTNVIPSILENGGMHNMDATKKHWDFAPKHYENLTTFIEDYFKDIKSYSDKNVCSLFQNIHADIDLKDISLLVSQLATIEPKFDKDIMMKIYKYCYLSILSKIISESDETNTDLIQTEQTTDEGIEIEIADNKQFFFRQVCQLLVIILDTDMKNKGSTNFNYSDLASKYHKESLAEKKQMTDRLKGMTKTDRDVENLLKEYKLENWFTDDTVYKYNKAKYGKEVGEGKENNDDRETPVFLGGDNEGDNEGVNEGFVLEEGDEDRNDNDN